VPITIFENQLNVGYSPDTLLPAMYLRAAGVHAC